MDGNKVYHQKVTAPELGSFMAVLSVGESVESSVYWSRQMLPISVIANISEVENKLKNLTTFTLTLWKMYLNLSEEYDKLESRVDSLPASPPGKK